MCCKLIHGLDLGNSKTHKFGKRLKNYTGYWQYGTRASSVVPNVLCLYNIVFYRATTVSKLNSLWEGHLTGHLSQVLLH